MSLGILAGLTPGETSEAAAAGDGGAASLFAFFGLAAPAAASSRLRLGIISGCVARLQSNCVSSGDLRASSEKKLPNYFGRLLSLCWQKAENSLPV